MISRKFLTYPQPVACLLGLLLIFNCSKSEEPPLPSSIAIVSGNNQYYMRGKKLPEPLVVEANTESGDAAENASVVFEVLQGGGSLSSGKTTANSQGFAEVEYTLGSGLGINIIKAYLEVDESKFVTFTETSSNFYCPEADTSLSVFYGNSGQLMLATFKSAIYSSSETNAGIVIIDPFSQNVVGFKEFPTDIFITQVWDIALSPKGELYMAKSETFNEIVKIAPDESTIKLAEIDDPDGAELETNPRGLIVGCDAYGPFFLTCGDSLIRFSEAFYPSRGINNNSLAVDQLNEDIYFISIPDRSLMRLPVDSATAAGLAEVVSSLTYEEATGARGMVWDTDGSVYILVDYVRTSVDTTKQFICIDSQGAKTILYNFLSRGQGAAAGTQSDLAIDRNLRMIYTIDTTNNQLLRFNLLNPQNGFSTIFTSQNISISGFEGERVGLVVLP